MQPEPAGTDTAHELPRSKQNKNKRGNSVREDVAGMQGVAAVSDVGEASILIEGVPETGREEQQREDSARCSQGANCREHDHCNLQGALEAAAGWHVQRL